LKFEKREEQSLLCTNMALRLQEKVVLRVKGLGVGGSGNAIKDNESYAI
jgi:hypothetical protein